jgi:hypothetical protein
MPSPLQAVVNVLGGVEGKKIYTNKLLQHTSCSFIGLRILNDVMLFLRISSFSGIIIMPA